MIQVNNIKPREKQVLVKPDNPISKETDSGLIRPDNIETDKKGIGEVLALGKGIEDIKVGDKVIYAVYEGEVLNFKDDPENIDYILLYDEDILAVCE